MSQKIPRHVSIIPDGNRRWAREKGLVESMGHIKSTNYENVKSLIAKAKDLGVEYLTLWGFSTENWNRGEKEKEILFEIIGNLTNELRRDAKENRVRFRHIGRKDRLPKELVEKLKKLEEETSGFDEFNVQLCLDYGGRDEILRVVNKLLESGKKEINENDFVNNLDTSGIPEPDLIIRTSGEKRLSGFMPFQGVYAELYFPDVHFPDFNDKELEKAVEEFGKRKRRFGK